MRRSGAAPKRRGHGYGAGLMRSGGALVARNPVAVGGFTAFLVTFCFVSANALWYQPQSHPGALLPTRTLEYSAPAPVQEQALRRAPVPARTVVEAKESPVPQPAPVTVADPVIAEVQEILTDLRLYDGPIDGIAGTRTHDAVRHYQRVVGLAQTGEIDDALLRHLGARSVAEQAPVPAPRPQAEMTASIAPAAAAAGGDSTVARIQKGLRAFGNHHIAVDGIAGTQTAAAIREFQSLFGLPETGNPDPAVLKKMQDLGLTD